MKRNDEYSQILSLLRELKKDHPNYNIGRHISLALSDYGDVWGTSDKEVLFAFTKYKTQLELDGDEIADATYVDKVVEDAMDLDHILDEEDDYE